jgi:hypothetical protein
MKTALIGLIVAIPLALAGCWTSLDEIRALPPPQWKGNQKSIDASQETVKKAVRAALDKATCAIQEESQANAGTHVLIGVTGMTLTSQGVWCKVWVEKAGDAKTSVRFSFQRRDPNAQLTPTGQVEHNFLTYLSAYVEEFAADESPQAKPSTNP